MLRALSTNIMSNNMNKKTYDSFSDFYEFYLSEHQNRTSRRLHVIGTSLVIILIATVITTRSWRLLFLLPIIGYSFAWVGHFFFEKNKPATFQYPFWSLLSDFFLWKDIVIGKIKW